MKYPIRVIQSSIKLGFETTMGRINTHVVLSLGASIGALRWKKDKQSVPNVVKNHKSQIVQIYSNFYLIRSC